MALGISGVNLQIINALGDMSTLPDTGKTLCQYVENFTTNIKNIYNGRGINSNTTLDNGEFGCHRYNKLTASVSPSGNDTEGLLLVFPAIYQSAWLQIFFGYQSQQVHMRMYWYNSYMNWVKISN